MTLAVLGLGSMGLRHARNILALGETVAGFDPDPARRALIAEAGGRAAESREEALDGARADVIASPNAWHLDDVAAALDAGCHVMIEKPLAHTVDGLESLLDTARKRSLVVFVAQNLRVHPSVLAAKDALDDGALGEPLWSRSIASSYLPDWRPAQDHRAGYAADPRTGGAIFDFIHEFDLAAHLLGPFETVAAVARCSGTIEIEAEDCVDAILRHERGVLTNLHLDYVTRPGCRVTEVAGTAGVLRLDISGRRLWRFDPAGEVVEDRSFGGEHADDYVTELKVFFACMAGEAEPSCDGREALAVLRQVVKARALAGLPQEKRA